MVDGQVRTLWDSEVIVTDLIGRLIEFWGFKRNMGRLWAVLYLSPEPMTARQLQEALQLSSGAVSMTLNELLRWGVIKKVWEPGQRRDHFTAEVQLWKMVSRVIAEREQKEVSAAIDACEQALRSLDSRIRSSDPKERERAELQRQRIVALLGLARLGNQLLSALVETAKVDAEPLSRLELTR